MNTDRTRYYISEGTLFLPANMQDQSVNAFTPLQADAPAFNVTRDRLGEGENLSGYLSRQLAMLAENLEGWTQPLRKPVQLGNARLEGECVHFNYLRNGTFIWHQQAIFAPDASHVLIFTMTKASVLTDADTQLFSDVLASFTFHR